MPGQSVCLQCGSVLAAESAPANVHPPRMAGWKKPPRLFFRRLRSHRLIQAFGRFRVPSWMRVVSGESFFAVLLSILPGLAHLIQRRFAQVRLYVAIWLVLLFGTLFFYGGFLGQLFFGFTIAMHAYIALQTAFGKELTDFRYRVLSLLLIGLGLLAIYWNGAGLIFRDIAGGYTSVRVPYHRTEAGDYVLARRSLVNAENLTRGSLVLAGVASIGDRWLGGSSRRSHVVAQIIARPDETLKIQEGLFIVDDSVLDPNEYPVPRWLKTRKLSVIISENHYFLSAQFQGQGYNDSHIVSVCVVPVGQIEAKAFIRWSPLIRRGFIREIE